SNKIERQVTRTFRPMKIVEVRCPTKFLVSREYCVNRWLFTIHNFVQDRYGTPITNEYVVFTEVARRWPNNLCTANRRHVAVPFVRSVPEEVADPSLDLDTREHIVCSLVIDKVAEAPVTEHSLSELAEAESRSHPA